MIDDLIPPISLTIIIAITVFRLKNRSIEDDNLQGGNGFPGYFSSATQQGIYRWPQEKLPIKVFIKDGSLIPGYRKFFYDALINSLDEWCASLSNKLTWQLASSEDSADIICTWTNTGRGFRLRKFVQQGETILQWISIINKPNNFWLTRATVKICTMSMFFRPLKNNEIKNICLHEMGHALGVRGHSPRRGDVMFYQLPRSYVFFDASLKMLSSRDVDTINYLYSEYQIN